MVPVLNSMLKKKTSSYELSLAPLAMPLPSVICPMNELHEPSSANVE